ncbi:MAG: uroporphyrin-III methyltransferase, partial [Proteobacteria bacterium]|nr:uroporphyrin-III methyltransferase [Pseudomonadota bacterium]
MQSLPFELPKFEPGWVWLAGAGPGDVGLLTLHALNALRQADVLVYDALVGQGILELVSADCELEYAGKRGGKPSAKQRDISLRLVELAEQGKRVLRLKGGDPFVFGRGGEEALCLVKAEIPFRIIPGISAGIGGLAYSGIAGNHREFYASVTLLSGYGMGGDVTGKQDRGANSAGLPGVGRFMAIGKVAKRAETTVRNGG